MLENFDQWLSEAKSQILTALDLKSLEDLKIKYLGKKSDLMAKLKDLSALPIEERKEAGRLLNNLKNELASLIAEKWQSLSQNLTQQTIQKEKLDISLPSKGFKIGNLHPLTQVMEHAKNVFKKLGYKVAEGPEVEEDYYNFEALNIPFHHPSRDMHDTFYITEDQKNLLRTHTSPVQIRVMKKNKPPLAIIAPGRVYRCDADVTHSPVFNQLEGFLVDKNITFADLKGTLTYFLREVFGQSRRVRFRPSYFPLTEPSAEVDVECIICSGKGCRVCKESGWLEILGSGMIDPNVFKFVGYDPEVYSGFAFGMGIERIAMLKFGIDDIRLFYENDVRFLEQF